MVGKSGKTVSAWENNHGQPDAEVLMKLCDIYNVKDILAEFRADKKEDSFQITDEEKKLIIAYRNHKDMQPAINKMLDIEKDERSTVMTEIAKEFSISLEKNKVQN